MKRLRPIVGPGAVLLALGALVAGCGASSSSSSSSSSSVAPTVATPTTTAATPAAAGVASGRVSVSISNYAFQPATITVALGSKVSFTNHDQTAHTATSIKTAFDTGTVQPGASATVTLKKPGTYGYYCQFHAFMHGTIVVK